MPTCVVVVSACGAIDCGLRIKSKYSFFYIYNIIRISLGLANVSVARFCLAKDVARSDWSSSWRRLRHPACQSGGGQCAACKEGIVRAIACRPNRQQQLQSANTHYRTQTHTHCRTLTHTNTKYTHTHNVQGQVSFAAVPTGVCVIYSFHARVSTTIKNSCCVHAYMYVC